MKTRTGFVSNSSGTSFVIFGVTCNLERWLKVIIENGGEEKIQEIIDSYDNENDEEFEALTTLEEKVQYIANGEPDILYDISCVFKDEIGFYSYDGEDAIYWLGKTLITEGDDSYEIQHVFKQIQLAKDIAKKYGFKESDVKMHSIFSQY